MVAHSAVEAPQSKLSYSAIAEYAIRIAKQHHVMGDNGHVDVQQLLDKLGGKVKVEDRSESLEVRGKGDFTIFLPVHTSRLRDRFTIAHELGHYFLHYRAPERLLTGKAVSTFTRLGRNIPETQANVFASNLLMPEVPFRSVFSEKEGDLVQLAHHFEVSVPAARVRAEFLGVSN